MKINFRIFLAVSLLGITALATAKPVTVKVVYNNIQPISNRLTREGCDKLIRNSTFQFNQDKPVSFRASPLHRVSKSHTVIKTKSGRDQVLVKIGKSLIKLPKRQITVNRISYIKIKPNGRATGILVLDGLCRASFYSTRATS